MDKRTLLVDTREQKNGHITAFLDEIGQPYAWVTCSTGDYQFDNSISVDKKYGLQEVYNNIIGKSHDRFRRECERAKEHGTQLVVLIEQPEIKDVSEVHKWRNQRAEKWYKYNALHKAGKCLSVKIPKVPPAKSEVLQKAMETMTQKYGVQWRFCSKAKTGETILSILAEGAEK